MPQLNPGLSDRTCRDLGIVRILSLQLPDFGRGLCPIYQKKGGSRLNRDNKQQLVTEMHEKLASAKAVFLADFRGMNVGKATTLQK